MKTQTFGIIIGVIIVAWLAAMFFLGYSRWDALGQKQDEAGQKISKLKKLAKKKDGTYPSDERKKEAKDYLDSYQGKYDAVLKHFDKRDESYKAYFTGDRNPSEAEWGTKQQDLLSTLREAYEAAEGDSKNLKFEAEGDLQRSQMRWTAFEAIVKTLLDNGGALSTQIKDENLKKRGALAADAYFSRWEWQVEAEVPPANVPKVLSALLGHEQVSFELAEITVAKKKELLIKTTLEEAEENDGKFEPPQMQEPRVRVKLVLHALEWQFEPPKQDGDEEEGDE